MAPTRQGAYIWQKLAVLTGRLTQARHNQEFG